ncbi:hypothetical protein PM082_014196 [Marasmius tenuissimus]|nr:hypothetical protein PM082_014196 [Marasmius tenuissimus]
MKAGLKGYDLPLPLKKHHLLEATTEPTSLLLTDIRAPENGFTGHQSTSGTKKTYTLDELVGLDSKYKFRLIKWDGSKTMILLMKDQRILVVFVGRPKDKAWVGVSQRVADRMQRHRAQARRYKKKKNRRGRYEVIACGVTLGMGMKKPTVQKQPNAGSAAFAQELLDNEDVKRIVGVGSSAFSTWLPDLYQSYVENQSELFQFDSSLKFPFDKSTFAATTFNLGPQTVTINHTDYHNRSDGFCAITLLSPTTRGFEYTKGGHLILWDLGVVVEFPPCTTALLPSAILRHSNTVIGKGEQQSSLTQYTAGSLFCWVEHGFRCETSFYAGLNKTELDSELEKDTCRWENAANNFAYFDDLVSKVCQSL